MRKIPFNDLMIIVEVARIALEDECIRPNIQHELSIDDDEMERIFQLVEIHDDSFDKDFWSNIPYQDKKTKDILLKDIIHAKTNFINKIGEK